MAEFLMPSLGADMQAGTLVEWLVAPGQALRRGDVIAVVETEKGAIEIENFEDGVFESPMVDIGARVPVGTPIARIHRTRDEAVSGEPARPAVRAGKGQERAGGQEASAARVTVVPFAPATGSSGQRVRASPAARRYAAEHGIDLVSVRGSGLHGEIQLGDVEGMRSPTPPAEAALAPALRPMEGMRAAIAAAMARSKREIPHYYLEHSVDLTAAEAWVSDFNTRRDPEERLVVGALFVKAVALSIRKFPEFNGHFIDGTFRQSPVVHAGVAINIRGTGLVAPAIHDADALGVPELMAAMRDLVARVRAGRFRASELSDPTITISSLGDRGVATLYGVIYPPQVAIVGFGTPMTEVRAVQGLIGPRTIVHVTLAGDHRVNDGHRGALFLSHIDHLLQKPEGL